MPINYFFASTKYYVLDLSPASMKCTHGAAVSCFVGCQVIPTSLTLMNETVSRPWSQRLQDELRITRS
jgi:hypothetical protein